MTIIYFILVLGIIILIHEFGHFIFAKKAGIYVYEFSLGMGPRIFKFKRKNDETEYSIRAFPIGGYVSMAGEDVKVDEKIDISKHLQSKTWLQRFLVVIAGVMMNFILAITLLFIYGIINSPDTNEAIISELESLSPFNEYDIKENDKIIEINGSNTKSLDMFLLEYQIALNGKSVEFTILKENNEVKKINVLPYKNEKDKYTFGFKLKRKIETGIFSYIKYAFVRLFGLINQVLHTLFYLIIGKLSIKNISGPIGIYSIVGEAARTGFVNIMYLTALLSLNVGIINLLPLPAFDGGRLFFMIIEKIIRKPIKPEIENRIHSVGMVLLIILMLIICFNDIIKLV